MHIVPLNEANANEIFKLRIFHTGVQGRNCSGVREERGKATMTVLEKLENQARRYWRESSQAIPRETFIEIVRDHLAEKAPQITLKCRSAKDLRAYIHRTINNACVDILRSSSFKKRAHVLFREDSRNETQAFDEISTELGMEASRRPDEVLCEEETLDIVYRYIELLPKTLGKTLRLYYLEGLTAKEVGKRMNCTARTVRARAKRARESWLRIGCREGIIHEIIQSGRVVSYESDLWRRG